MLDDEANCGLDLRKDGRSKEQHTTNARRPPESTCPKPKRARRLTTRPRSSWLNTATRFFLMLSESILRCCRNLGRDEWMFLLSFATRQCLVRPGYWEDPKVASLHCARHGLGIAASEKSIMKLGYSDVYSFLGVHQE